METCFIGACVGSKPMKMKENNSFTCDIHSISVVSSVFTYQPVAEANTMRIQRLSIISITFMLRTSGVMLLWNVFLHQNKKKSSL